MANAINWFEIPVSNFERAYQFYSTVLGGEIHRQEGMGVQMGFLPTGDNQGVGGAICAGKDYKPSTEGIFIYLNGGEDLSGPLSRVEQAGGKVLLPKTKISDEIGYLAHFQDTEGNKLAFHSLR
jgi:predicted enzyme related to lactoylglutathione lyase